MGQFDRTLSELDELYLERAYELAARGVGGTAPNPPVGAVVVRENRIVGEGYHHRAGDPHAEVIALTQAAGAARGATLYVSLEPCGHVGRTPPCTHALVEAGIVRVVAGTLDPTHHGGAGELREGGVEVDVSNDAVARELIEAFARNAASNRPYVALKMAMSLDGAITGRRGVREQLTGEAFRRYVRDLRFACDAVMVGAGTIRVDDPELTVRPARDRGRPYVRVVACEREGVSPSSRIFAPEAGYARSIVLVPGMFASRLDNLREVADVIAVGPPSASRLDLKTALEALHDRQVFSVLCEGGPTIAARLIGQRLVDRVFWAIAPRFLGGESAVPVLSGADSLMLSLQLDRVERVGEDVVISGTFENV